MRYFIPGLIAGACAALFLFLPAPGIEICPEWWGGVNALSGLEKSPVNRGPKAGFFVRANDRDYAILAGDGGTAVAGSVTDGLAAFSGSGRFYVKYQTVGSAVEFFNAAGDRFWRLESLEYPYLSHNGKLVMLMNGDHSGIRLVDYDGNLLGAPISGRTCTALSFSDSGDFGAAGFLDGSYYFVSPKGKIIGRGMTPAGTMVKGIAVSGSGSFGAVHSGSNAKDFVRIVDLESGDHDEAELSHVHHVRTSLHAGDDGYCAVIDVDRVLYISPSGRVKMTINIPPKRPGHSSIRFLNGVYAVSYTEQGGAAKLILFRDDGVILFSQEFPSESFLDVSLQGSLVFLRGSDHVYCYSIHGM